MTLKLPTFVFLFEPQPDLTFHATLAARSSHMIFNITDPLQDAAAGLGLPWTDLEDQLRLRWPSLLGSAIMNFCETADGDSPPAILTHCKFIEDLSPFIDQFGPPECLALNLGPIWKLPLRCRTITIPVSGVEERIAYLQNELNSLERATTMQVINGPKCHPEAFWVPEDPNSQLLSQAVCSICGQPGRAGGEIP